MAKSKSAAAKRPPEHADGKSLPAFPHTMEGRVTSAASVISEVNRVSPASDELIALLKIPPVIYFHGPYSFSTNKLAPLDDLAEAVRGNRELPDQLPRYGIQVSSEGSSSFCSFIDRDRHVIVRETVSNAYLREAPSWSRFLSSLKSALSEAERLDGGGKNFRYVIISDRVMSVA